MSKSTLYRLLVSSLIVVVAAGLLSACQPQATTSAPAGQGTTQSPTQGKIAANQVSIQNMAFSPQTMNIKVGDTVVWSNNDSFAHTVTSDSGEFESQNLSKGDTFQFTFTKAGTFPYHCSIHTSMTGTVVVTE